MDRFIATFPAQIDGDLALCPAEGVAYQRDMRHPVEYNGAYFDKYVGYEDTPISLAINAGRIALVNRHVGSDMGVLDVGIGSGEFVKKRPNTFGYDINQAAVDWLKSVNRWTDKFAAFDAFTFWDVLEHVEHPESYFSRIPHGAWLFTAIPVFDDLRTIRSSKHYRPDEHFYYFTERGFTDWMGLHGFRLVERADYETRAGRDSILSFAFHRA